MSGISIPRLLQEGAVLQRNKKIYIWGFCEAGTEITVSLCAHKVTVTSGEKNRFDAYLPPMEAGGPYELIISDEKESVTISNILIGDVFVMCGQSNMEFPMSRVRDTFPEEWNNLTYPNFRIFKIQENYVFEGPLEELETGSWVSIGPDMLDACPAIGYFLCQLLNEKTGVAVGVINASLGGSPIESWMSREMLSDYPQKLEEADFYKDEKHVRDALDNNNRINNEWRALLDERDQGVKGNWQNITDLSNLDKIDLPEFFDNTELNGHIGSVWLFREFDAGEELLGTDSVLWLGTLVDSDITYINGVEVGRTEYKYPPRRYKIDKNLLKKGRNILAIRLRIETGAGRVTPGKKLAIITGNVKRTMVGINEGITGEDYCIDLSGEWSYRIGAKMDRIEPVNFVNWKPTGLYNGMLYACTNYAIAAFIFYQGESNTDESLEYYDKMTCTQVNALRALWKDEKLPYIYTRLPNFVLNGYEKYEIVKNETWWNRLKEVQNRIEDELPYSYMAVTDGMGEDNDVHPQNKKAVAEEYARILLENKIVG